MRRQLRLLPTAVALVLVAALVAGCMSCGGREKDNRVQVKAIIAGSLLVPFQTLEREFENRNPGIDVQLEGHGSVQVIRSVTELGKIADVVAVADAQLIPLLMYSASLPGGGTPYADWSIKFSTNRLGIACQPTSAHAAEMDAEHWPAILSRPDVTIGLADPRIDAMGYRTLMAVKMAEDHYRDDALFEKTIGAAFDPPMAITEDGGIRTISVPEVVKSTQSRIKLRSYSIQLMALLESGDLDYSFEYESVAKQRGLGFVALPPAIDLGSPDFEEEYQRVRVNLDFRRFASVMPSFEGTQIMYALTIPKNSPHPEEASRLIEFLLGPDGRRIFEESWQPLIPAPVCDNPASLPETLRQLVR